MWVASPHLGVDLLVAPREDQRHRRAAGGGPACGSGVFLLASRNMTHSASGANANDGGPFKIVQAR